MPITVKRDLPALDEDGDIIETTYSATQLARELGLVSAHEANFLLVLTGLQYKTRRAPWTPTKRGQRYARAAEVWRGTELVSYWRWSEAVLPVLREVRARQLAIARRVLRGRAA